MDLISLVRDWVDMRILGPGCGLTVRARRGRCGGFGAGRRDRTVDPALRALVRSYEYEDWPRGRIVFDRSRDLFILYVDRRLLTPAMIARIETQFHLPEERTEIQSDFHFQSTETPNVLERVPNRRNRKGIPESAES
jgi:hypothetical protein